MDMPNQEVPDTIGRWSNEECLIFIKGIPCLITYSTPTTWKELEAYQKSNTQSDPTAN